MKCFMLFDKNNQNSGESSENFVLTLGGSNTILSGATLRASPQD